MMVETAARMVNPAAHSERVKLNTVNPSRVTQNIRLSVMWLIICEYGISLINVFMFSKGFNGVLGFVGGVYRLLCMIAY